MLHMGLKLMFKTYIILLVMLCIPGNSIAQTKYSQFINHDKVGINIMVPNLSGNDISGSIMFMSKHHYILSIGKTFGYSEGQIRSYYIQSIDVGIGYQIDWFSIIANINIVNELSELLYSLSRPNRLPITKYYYGFGYICTWYIPKQDVKPDGDYSFCITFGYHTINRYNIGIGFLLNIN